MQNIEQAAEQLEKFAEMSYDGMSRLGSDIAGGIGNAASYVGGLASSAGKQVADAGGAIAGAVGDRWKALPEPVRRGATGAATGATLATILEAMRNKKKKNYASHAVLGGVAGGLVPFTDLNEITGLAKYAEGSDWISKVMGAVQDNPALVGGGIGAVGGALTAGPNRRLLGAALGGATGAGLGAAAGQLPELLGRGSAQAARHALATNPGTYARKGLFSFNSGDAPAGVDASGNADTVYRQLGRGAVSAGAGALGEASSLVTNPDSLGHAGALLGAAHGLASQGLDDHAAASGEAPIDRIKSYSTFKDDKGKVDDGRLSEAMRSAMQDTYTRHFPDNAAMEDRSSKLDDQGVLHPGDDRGRVHKSNVESLNTHGNALASTLPAKPTESSQTALGRLWGYLRGNSQDPNQIAGDRVQRSAGTHAADIPADLQYANTSAASRAAPVRHFADEALRRVANQARAGHVDTAMARVKRYGGRAASHSILGGLLGLTGEALGRKAYDSVVNSDNPQ